MKRGEVRLFGAVMPVEAPEMQSFSAAYAAEQIDKRVEEGCDALDVYLSSDGGDVGEGLAIHDQIQRFPGDVTIRVDGRALSIASVIALSGKRLVLPESALFMIHGPRRLTFGDRREHARADGMLATMERTMRGIYARKTKLPEERIQKMMDEETWMSAAEAKAFGFADDAPPAPSARPRAYAEGSLLVNLYRNTPAALRTLSAEAALAKLEGIVMRSRMAEIARGSSAAVARGARADTTK